MNFFSRGKLLISGEYLVLKGATSLAVPLLKGQKLIIKKRIVKPQLLWKSNVYSKEWFRVKFDLAFFEILETSDKQVAHWLQKLLLAARKLNPYFLNEGEGYSALTEMDFNREWGFGSSSSLISNVAYWAQVDEFELHRKVSKGSGYDVVAARQTQPFFFTRSINQYTIEETSFHPSFSDRIFFIYLGKKQDSAESVDVFLEKKKQYRPERRMISALSRLMAEAPTLTDFEHYIKEHNLILESILKTQGLKQTIFNDLKGEVKPLGAWGGDFAMLTWNDDPEYIEHYFRDKKIETVFRFNELIKTK